MSTAQQPWYKTAFESEYLELYSHRDEEEAQLLHDLVSSHVQLKTGGMILDLCCGAGRHSEVFCSKGHRVVGLDLSRALLTQAKTRVCNQMRFLRGDMRHLPFQSGEFAGILHLFTAFGYFQQDEENFHVFSEVHRILQPQGWYLFDYLNAPKVRSMNTFEGRTTVENLPGIGRVETTKRLVLEGKRIRKDIRFLDAPTPKEYHEDVALYDPERLEGHLSRSGLRVEHVFGDYAGSDFHSNSSRWMALCRKA